MEYLMRYGTSICSKIIANGNVFMTIKTQDQIIPDIIEDYQNINKHTKATPEWQILKIIDGFGEHHSSKKAMQLQDDTKVLTVKEETELSHILSSL